MSPETVTFALIYVTFFLDNVLLTALVPIVPELLGEDEELAWNNGTFSSGVVAEGDHGGGGGGGAWAGVVLGAKAGAQLVCAPLAADLTRRRGPTSVLRAATALLAAAAIALCVCAGAGAEGAWRAAGLVVSRAAQGAGAAGAGVAGLAAAARAQPGAVGALLGAVALGVLVGYPLGGAAYALWSRAAPFQLTAGALLVDLALQHACVRHTDTATDLDEGSGEAARAPGYGALAAAARAPPAAGVAGAVLLTTCVMAALEPCLPVWLMHRFHPQRWARGAVFVPDSAGYLAATSLLGRRRLGARGARGAALAGQVALGLAALALPLAPAAGWLLLPHAALGAGLGATDAALVPALLAARPRHVAALAALLQASSSAAYALGPAAGGALAARVGFAPLVQALGVANLLYAGWLARHLARHPLQPPDADADAADSPGAEGLRLVPPAAHAYHALH